ncbi:dephospho-CoA kinase [Fervidobacterium thailandense]|uniref:Dephospho-CoA kinase n=1 Tax=Fervidobacterium thailandense TaxID=1008305 RepID=A0A1E3G556_9BACT|nr:dephospho-CoA kinase [Fervidobacterium thailandense]ODN31387.1 dephospho-CoA kinase [Fervidobacterium thailandense]
MVVCVTGKVGTGKTTVAEFFKERGFYYINMDQIGHRTLEIVRDEVERVFGTSDRKKLRELVFSSEENLKRLEAIVHPVMLQLFYEELEKALKITDNVVVEAAILKRLGLKCCDVLITVKSREEVIKERLRGKYTPEMVDKVLSMQKDIEDVGYVIENNGTLEELHSQLIEICASLGLRLS